MYRNRNEISSVSLGKCQNYNIQQQKKKEKIKKLSQKSYLYNIQELKYKHTYITYVFNKRK